MTGLRPLALVVEMRVRPGMRAAFLPLILENARRSLADEPGCSRFDVLVPEQGTDRIVLYEIYDGDEAFQAHCQTEHYLRFKERARDMLEETTVQRFGLVESGCDAVAIGWA